MIKYQCSQKLCTVVLAWGDYPYQVLPMVVFYCTIFITVVNWYFSEYYSFVYIHGLSVNDQQLYLQNHMDVLYEILFYFNSLTWVSVVKCDWDCNYYRYLGFVVTQEVTKPPAF